MADPPAYPDTVDETGAEPDGGSTPSTPVWVKVFGLIALVVVVLFVVLLLFGGGGHSPGRHSSGGSDDDAPLSSVTRVHTPPLGVVHGEQQPWA